MPLFERTSRRYTIDDIVKTVFDPLDDKKMCAQQPSRVKYNGVFLIDTKEVNFKDIVADGNGVFLHIGQPTVAISLGNDHSVAILARTKQKLVASNQFHVHRVYIIAIPRRKSSFEEFTTSVTKMERLSMMLSFYSTFETGKKKK